jgi:hypothetical protein
LLTVWSCNGGSGLTGKTGRKTVKAADKQAKNTIRNSAAHFTRFLFTILLRESWSTVLQKAEWQAMTPAIKQASNAIGYPKLDSPPKLSPIGDNLIN